MMLGFQGRPPSNEMEMCPIQLRIRDTPRRSQMIMLRMSFHRSRACIEPLRTIRQHRKRNAMRLRQIPWLDTCHAHMIKVREVETIPAT